MSNISNFNECAKSLIEIIQNKKEETELYSGFALYIENNRKDKFLKTDEQDVIIKNCIPIFIKTKHTQNDAIDLIFEKEQILIIANNIDKNIAKYFINKINFDLSNASLLYNSQRDISAFFYEMSKRSMNFPNAIDKTTENKTRVILQLFSLDRLNNSVEYIRTTVASMSDEEL